MIVLAIDPGTDQSAFVVTRDGIPEDRGIFPNDVLLTLVARSDADELVIEMVASYGMPVGREIFDTCVWIGRFIECWTATTSRPAHRLYRKDVKLHLCGHVRAKDPNVRRALIDRFGPGQERACGTTKNRGPLYGFKKDEWAALALAITFHDQRGQTPAEASHPEGE